MFIRLNKKSLLGALLMALLGGVMSSWLISFEFKDQAKANEVISLWQLPKDIERDAVPVTGDPFGVLNPVVVRMIVGVLGEMSTGNDAPELELPDENLLGLNYPNPFNERTTISYDLARASRVVLTV